MEYDRLEALQGRDSIRGIKPSIERSRLQDQIAWAARVGVSKDVVVAENQVVTVSCRMIAVANVPDYTPKGAGGNCWMPNAEPWPGRGV